MALVTLNRTFIFQVMAWNAGLVGDILAPSVNYTNLASMAIKAIIMYTRLVFPMIELEFHYPHLESNYFTAPILRRIRHGRRNISRKNQATGRQHHAQFHTLSYVHMIEIHVIMTDDPISYLDASSRR
jgi:hypothetical protein